MSRPDEGLAETPPSDSDSSELLSPLAAIQRVVPAMLFEAETNIDIEAQSHRGFNVRTVLLGINLKRKLDVIMGANFTQYPTEYYEVKTRLCSEQDALNQADIKRWRQVFLMVILGNRQVDDLTGLETPTLHPCSQTCQERLEHDPLVRPETLVITFERDLQIAEVHNVAALLEKDRRKPVTPVEEYPFVTDMTLGKAALVNAILGEIHASSNPLFLPDGPWYKTSSRLKDVVAVHQRAMVRRSKN